MDEKLTDHRSMLITNCCVKMRKQLQQLQQLQLHFQKGASLC
jgi:hypothetical protein